MKAKHHQLFQSIMLFSFLGLSLFIMGVVTIGVLQQHSTGAISISQLYGVWSEQDAPPYNADEFEIHVDGILVGGAIVTTQYEFDGNSLRYRIGQEQYEYELNAETLVRLSPSYRARFERKSRLSGS
ncbi:DUF2850 domain-containing protein [Thaumasiovibrio sp. DFM-14]|uniref:DUF2850 domain-containing protein n=1 Tax=Thaumasiovibrio sp. DFM-14 TaxID=3384792 RepID=UPI0039A3E00E